MAIAKSAFFHAKDDGSEGFVNAGEVVPEGVDAGENVRVEEPEPEAPRPRSKKSD